VSCKATAVQLCDDSSHIVLSVPGNMLKSCLLPISRRGMNTPEVGCFRKCTGAGTELHLQFYKLCLRLWVNMAVMGAS
jgi:hypothetical protein